MSSHEKDDDSFLENYKEAISCSEYPAISEIRKMVTDILRNPNLPPATPTLWPLHTFLCKSIDLGVPVNKLLDPPFAESLERYRGYIFKINAVIDRSAHYIIDPQGNPVRLSERVKKQFCIEIIDYLLDAIQDGRFQDIGTEIFGNIDHLHARAENGMITKLLLCTKKEAAKKTATKSSESEEGKVLYEADDQPIDPFMQAKPNKIM